jgi:hypothetical protein
MADQQEIPDELVITLRKPIEFGGETYTELTLREPTAGEYEQVDNVKGPTATDIIMVSLVSGVPKQVIAKVGMRDLNKAAKYLGSFIV